MRFAVNPLQWYQQPDGSLDFDRKPPLRAVLAGVHEAGFDAMHAERWPGCTTDEYLDAFSTFGITPAPGYFSFSPSEDGTPEEALTAAADEADRHRALGLDRIFLATNVADERMARPAAGSPVAGPALAGRVAQIEQIATIFKDRGVQPCFHQHVGTVIETAEELRAVLDGAPSCSFGPDVGHLSWAGMDPLAIMAEYQDRIGAVHLKDCHLDIARQAVADGAGYLETTLRGIWDELGDGDLPLRQVLELVDEPDRWVIVEVDHTFKKDPIASGRACADWIATWKDNHK